MKKTVLIIICIILIAVILGLSIWLIVVDAKSRKYNLIKLDPTDKVPVVNKVDFEGDVQLDTGVKMHYARYGNGGEPLVLIHGNGGSHHSLEELAYYFADEYTVYAIDSRCQGESSVTDRVSYALMASDVNAFCKEMDIVKPLVIGHSDGGIIALQIAMDYPLLMKGFVSCGANSTPSAFKPYFTIPIKARYKSKPVELDRIMIEEPSFTKEDLEKIICPAYIVAGEFDIMYLRDTAFIADSIRGSKVAIVKWGGHSYIRDGARGYALCKPFFEEIED